MTKEIYICPRLKSNLNDLHEAVNKKWDGLLLIDGIEGSGKSTMGATIGLYMSNIANKEFTIDNIIWTPEQFEKKVNEAQPHEVIMWDEFVMGGLSTEALSTMQRILIKYFTTIRKKQLIILLLIPYIFLLRSYFAVARTRALIHVTTPDGIQRGTFDFYNYENKKYLFFLGKKWWTYPRKVPISFHGYHKVKSLSELGLDEAEYERRKDEAIKGLFVDKKKLKEEEKERIKAEKEAKKKAEEEAWLPDISKLTIDKK